jgi:ATP/maltotriose-dependent transcriptional regulator MalT
LALLAERAQPVSHGGIAAACWLGHDPLAVRIARTRGDEEDAANSLDPLDWRSAAETERVRSLVRSWQRPAAILRGLDVVGRDCLHRHGDFRRAGEVYQDLLDAAVRYGSLPGQAEAVAQLSAVRATLGDLNEARDLADRARQLVARLGAEHRLHVVVDCIMPSVLAYYTEGDWPQLAATAEHFARSAAASRSPVGLLAAGFAASHYTCAGDRPAADRLLGALTPLLEAMQATMYLHTPTVHMAAAAVWELGAAVWAPRYVRLARQLIDLGAGSSPIGSHHLTLARMHTLLGDVSAARVAFAAARVELNRTGQRPLCALADADEAAALTRRPAAAPAGAPARPNGLTVREVEVLGLIAGGATNKQIAAALVVSPATVERHISNLYGKIGAHGRASATAFALTHGLQVFPLGPATPVGKMQDSQDAAHSQPA